MNDARFRRRGAVGVVILTATLGLGAVGQPSDSAVQNPPRLRGVVDLTIGRGSDETRDPYVFQSISGLAWDANGGIVVVDRRDANIRIFSAAGVYRYTIGRSGQGPGEFSSPCCVAIAPNGQLWVADGSAFRYSVFNLARDSGSLVKSVAMPIRSSPLNERVRWDSVGHVIQAVSTSFRMPGQASLGTPIIVRTFVDSMGRTVHQDTMRSVPVDSIGGSTLQVASGGGTATYWSAQPFGPLSLRTVGPNGDAALAVSSRYSVTWIDAGQRPLHVLQRSVVGPPVTGMERQAEESSLVAYAQRFNVTRASLNLTVPDRKTPLMALGFDLDGRLWIQRRVPEGSPNEADVYDRGGRWIAMMEWPANVTLTAWTVRGSTALAVARDSLDAISIVRLQFR